MLTIRLQRVGKKKFATYKVIVSEKGRDTHDKYLELLGTYNPHAKEKQFQPISERIQYWISKGAQTSGTINNLLVTAGIIKGKKTKTVFLSKKRTAKVAEKNKGKAEAAVKAKADKEAKAEADAKAAEEAKEAAKAAEAKAAADAAPAPETPTTPEAPQA